MIGDSVDVAGIARRNWKLYGTFFAGIVAAVSVTWYLAGGKQEQVAAPAASQQQPYIPQTRLEFARPTRTYEPPPTPQPVQQQTAVREQRPQMQQPWREEGQRPSGRPVASTPPAAPTLGNLFGGETDSEAIRYFDKLPRSGNGRDPNARIGGGSSQQPEVQPGLDDGFPSLITEDDRQGLVSQKTRWAASVGKRGDFVVTSKYENSLGPGLVQAGKTVIRAQMALAINSDIPGEFYAQVVDPVCDSPTGTMLLIPPGTFVQGEYNPQLSYGQTRLQVAGAVLRFDNGDYQPIEGMGAYGPDGEPGLPADVDRHPWHMAAAVTGAAFLSIIGQAGQMLAGDSEDPDIVVMGAQGASSQTRSIGTEIMQRELRRPNTLRYRVGEIIDIVVNKDFILPSRGYCR